MPKPSRSSAPRYRRRILGIGLIAAGALYSIGAPIYVRGIESDLERRVPEHLAGAGFGSVSAEFSGQNGTLTCDRPLDDPEAATDAAYSVRGVHSITIERSCRISRAPSVENDDSSADQSASGSGDSAGSDESTSSAADFATIADVISADPRLAYLSVLIGEAQLTEQLSDPAADPVTLFAPTDEAFDALPADLNAQLRSDPELLADVLARHVASGELLAADLAAGDVTTIDGTELDVTVSGGQVSVDGARLIDTDVMAGNGVVHVIERVLIPSALERDAPELAGASVALDAGQLTFAGVVASEVERARLLAAAGSTPAIDQLTVDPDTGLGAQPTSDLIALVKAMPVNLFSGVASYDDSGLTLDGVAQSDEASVAITEIATSLGVTPTLEVADVPTPTEAEQLESALNEFVAANPVRFEPGSAVLTADASAVLDQIAEQLLAAGPVRVVVEGHTDSDGDAAENRTLSQRRADAVRIELIGRGVVGDAISAEGLGSDVPVLAADGTEDKDASRRVEFRIESI